MEKHIINVKLMNQPLSKESYGENYTNGKWFDGRAENVIVINPCSFVVSFIN